MSGAASTGGESGAASTGGESRATSNGVESRATRTGLSCHQHWTGAKKEVVKSWNPPWKSLCIHRACYRLPSKADSHSCCDFRKRCIQPDHPVDPLV